MSAAGIPGLIGPLLETFEADAFAYAPDGPTLDLRGLVTSDGPERWSDAGAPTAYLALDIGVLLAEWARNVDHDEPASASLWQVRVRRDRILDLRGSTTRARLGLPARPDWFLDEDRARDVAARLRYAGDVGGLVVPAAAFPDRLDRGNVVVFLDDPRAIAGVVRSPARVGTCRHAVGASPGLVDDGRGDTARAAAHAAPSRAATGAGLAFPGP